MDTSTHRETHEIMMSIFEDRHLRMNSTLIEVLCSNQLNSGFSGILGYEKAGPVSNAITRPKTHTLNSSPPEEEDFKTRKLHLNRSKL